MTLDKTQRPLNPRKKATAGVILLVVFILVWQISSLFGKASSPPKAGGASVAVAQTANSATTTPPPPPPPPKPAEVPQTVPMTEREIALMTLQQETQTKYLEALNELQMLKVTRDIAFTNRDITNAILGKVESQKKIVEMLAPTAPLPPPPSASTSTSTQTSSTQTTTTGGLSQEVTYTVVSISQIQYRWGAVLSYNGRLYNVHVGDILPSDGSMVVAIAKESVTLQSNGVQKKISLVPII